MARHNRFSIASLIVFLLLPATLAFVFSCDQESTILYDEVVGDLSGTGTVDPEAGDTFLLGSVTNAELTPGRIEIWAKNVAFDSEKGTVSFDVELVNRSLVVIPPPIWFVITSIAPPDISVVEPDGSSRDGFPFYDFSDALGEDDLFSPDERTAPVTMTFHTVTARSFAIGYRIDLGPAEGEGVIGGIVFRDGDRDGELDRCDRCFEPGIPGITVALEKPLSAGGMVMLLSRTDSLGRYHFGGLGEGVYKVFVVAPEDLWEVTSANPLLVTLVAVDGVVQNFLGAHFGLFPIPPPVPEVLFGPILVGPASLVGIELDSTFVNPPSLLTVVYSYYLDVVPPFEWPLPLAIGAAEAWVNGELVFEYERSPSDSIGFVPRTVRLRDDLVKIGENAVRLYTNGGETAALLWRVYRQP